MRNWGAWVTTSILLGALILNAQVSTSRLTGTVQDSTGAVVAGAKVTATNEGTNLTLNTITSDNGTYVFDSIQTGPYSINIEAAGFKRYSTHGNIVSIGQPSTVNATLELGATSEQITVAATAELVQTSTSGNIGNVLSEKTIKDLPIVGTRGRNPLQLVLQSPGVFEGSNTGGGVHVNGARDRAWNFTLDGIDNNDPSAGGSSFSPTRMNPDDVAEYRVITSNATADVGRNSGATVTLVSKSGTNEFHGTGFWFYRTPRLNANEWSNNFNSFGKRMFVQNIYGGGVGGPIIKNRTFFYTNIQRLYATETRSANRLVYTQTARQGILRYVAGGRNRPAGASGAAVDLSGNVVAGVNVKSYNVAANDPQHVGLDQTIAAAVAKTPLPNNFTGGDGLNTAYFSWAAPQLEKQEDNLVRIDHQINSRNYLFFRAAWGFQNTVCDAGNSGTAFFPGEECNVNTERDPKNLAFSWRTVPSARVVNEFIFGHSEFTFNFISPQAKQGQIFFQGGDGGGTVSNNPGVADAPVLVSNLSYAIGNLRTIRTRQFVDNLSVVRGSHTFKTGFNIRFVQHQDVRGSIGGSNANQTVTFDPTINTVDSTAFNVPADLNTQFDLRDFQKNINFMLGRVGRTQRGFASNGQSYVDDLLRVAGQYGELEFYGQDTWKLSRNFTLDVGLRWELRNEPSEASGLIRRPDQPLVVGAPPTNTAKWIPGGFYKKDWNNLGPSIGFAWDPFNSGRTSIRSNYRIAYDRLPTFGLSTIFQTLPGITLGTTNDDFGRAGGRLANLPKLTPPNVTPDSLSQPAAASNNNITVVDPNLETATTHMWSIGIQREVVKNVVVSVDYIGRRAYNLYGAYNANQAEIFRNGFLDAFNAAKAGGESQLLDTLTSVDTRRRTGESGAAFIRRQFPSELTLNSVGGVAISLAQNSSSSNYTANAGLSPYFFLPFPQFAGRVSVIDSNDFSTYHGLEMQVEKRYGAGITAQFSWTFSKSLDTRSFDPSLTIVSTGSNQSASSTPFDVKNRKLNYAPSDFDRRHVLQSYWVWELPFGHGRRLGSSVNGVMDRVIGGWQIAGTLRYQTGRPFTVFSGGNTLSSTFQSTADCTGCSPDMGHVFTDKSGVTYFFEEADRAKFSSPAAGSIGNTGRNYFRMANTWDMDASFLKRIAITESGRVNFEIRADATNLTNTPQWDVPTATRTSGTFGRLGTPLDVSRKFQLGAKVNF
jgi:hypothetical protein